MGKTKTQPKPPFPAQDTGPPPGLEKDMSPRPRYKGSAYRAAGKLEGQVALITGGDSGIGRSVAVLFAKEGAHVAFTYLPIEKPDADETLKAIETEGREGFCIAGDVRNSGWCEDVVEQTVNRFGKLDILVNNAAFQKHREVIDEVSLEQWDETFKTNIYGYFHMVKAAMPHLKKGAVIINTGSITGLEGSPELLDYSATKGAIHAFTKSLAQSLVKKGYPRKLRRARPGLDAAQSGGAERRRHQKVWGGHATQTAGTA